RTLARHHDLSTQSWALPRRGNGRAAVTALLARAGEVARAGEIAPRHSPYRPLSRRADHVAHGNSALPHDPSLLLELVIRMPAQELHCRIMRHLPALLRRARLLEHRVAVPARVQVIDR